MMELRDQVVRYLNNVMGMIGQKEYSSARWITEVYPAIYFWKIKEECGWGVLHNVQELNIKSGQCQIKNELFLNACRAIKDKLF